MSRWIGACLAVMLVVATPCGAVMTKARTEELTVGAAAIAVADVVAVESAWGCDRTTIFTHVSLHVTDWLKGAGSEEITARVEGGEVDGIGLWVEDEPIFAEGERVVVFLEPSHETDVMQIKGHFQGRFTIEKGKVIEAGLPLTDFTQKIKRILVKYEAEGE